MKSLSEFRVLFLYRIPVDMRKSIDSLSVIVQTEMKRDLRSSSLFIFCNKRRTHLKILYFDQSGFALWLKRLEESKFPWPKEIDSDVIQMSVQDFEMILDGINIWSRFKTVHFERVI